jgi:hypothetical protein
MLRDGATVLATVSISRLDALDSALREFLKGRNSCLDGWTL